MDVRQGIEIYSLDDIVINTALGKDVILNGQVYTGNGIGIKWDKFKDHLTVDPENIYSTKDVIIRTDMGKSVIINGTAYPSTTGIARVSTPISSFYQQGFNWYCKDNIIINIAPGQKIIINDVEITGTPDGPSTATVGSLSPNTGQANSNVLVDVNGTGFTASTVVYVNSVPVQTTYVSATKLTTTYFGTETNVATYQVGVKKTGELLSNTLPFNLTPDVDDPSTATVSGLSPNTALVSSGQLVTVTGTGFTASTVIYASGNPVQTTYVSATSLTTTYLGTVSGAGTIPVGVKKPGELISNTVNFTVTTPPAPNISSLSPSTLVVSSGTLVTITGTNFVSGCVIKADGVGVQTTFVSATQLTTTYLGTVSAASTVAITVQNPDTQTSNSVNFSITAPVGGGLPVTTGLQCWWDADDAASIIQSANAVSQWNDKSGNSFHVTQSTAGEKPTTNTVTQNGKNVLVFDGGDVLSKAGTTGVDVDNVTTFIVAKQNAAEDNAGILTLYDSGASGDYNSPNAFTINTSDSTKLVDCAINNAANAWALGSGLMPWTVISHITEQGANNAPGHIWLNGVLQEDWGAAVTSYGVATGGIIIGGRWVTSSIYATSRFNGYIAEIIIYNRVLTTVERQQVEAYLKAKWGTP